MRYFISAMFCLFLVVDSAQASYGIYVGKNCTADGSVFLGGYGDEPSSHWLEIVPRREHPAGATIKVVAAQSYFRWGRPIGEQRFVTKLTSRQIQSNRGADALPLL